MTRLLRRSIIMGRTSSRWWQLRHTAPNGTWRRELPSTWHSVESDDPIQVMPIGDVFENIVHINMMQVVIFQGVCVCVCWVCVFRGENAERICARRTRGSRDAVCDGP